MWSLIPRNEGRALQQFVITRPSSASSASHPVIQGLGALSTSVSDIFHGLFFLHIASIIESTADRPASAAWTVDQRPRPGRPVGCRDPHGAS